MSFRGPGRRTVGDGVGAAAAGRTWRAGGGAAPASCGKVGTVLERRRMSAWGRLRNMAAGREVGRDGGREAWRKAPRR